MLDLIKIDHDLGVKSIEASTNSDGILMDYLDPLKDVIHSFLDHIINRLQSQ